MIKLRITPDEEALKETILGNNRKSSALRDLLANRGGFLLETYRETTLGFPTEFEKVDKKIKMKFAVAPTFRVAAAFNKEGDFRSITVDTEDYQITVYSHGVEDRTNFTLAGNGVGEEVLKARKAMLELLLSNHDACRRAAQWLREHALQPQAA